MNDLQRALRGDYGRRDLPTTEPPMTEAPPTTTVAAVAAVGAGAGRPSCEDCGAPNADTWITVYEHVSLSDGTPAWTTSGAAMLVGRTMYLCCPCSDKRLEQEQEGD